MSNLARAHCPNDHIWDAWGIWVRTLEGTIFEPDELQTCICPSCGEIADEFQHHERLA